MRRLICLLLILSAALWGCSGDDTEAPSVDGDTYGLIADAVERYNQTPRRKTTALISFTDGEESKYFTQGTFAYDRSEPIGMSGRTTEVHRGNGVSSDVYYKAGAYYYSGEGGKFYESFDRQLFLDQYLCANLSLCTKEDVTGFRTAVTDAGTKYVLTANDTRLFNKLFGETVALYSGLRKLQTEKTRYTNGQFICVVDAKGMVKSYSVSCDVVLYDTPGYYPTGYTPDGATLRHTFSLSYEVSVKAMGDAVEIEVPKTEEYTFLG